MFNPAHVLRDQMDAEKICQERLREIAKSAILTDEERAGVLAQADEEIVHEQAFEQVLAAYGGREAGEAGRETVYQGMERLAPKIPEPALRVADFRVIERFMRPVMKSARELFRGLGDERAVAAYDMILADEESHVEFNRNLYNRLRSIPGFGTQIHDRWNSLRTDHYSKPFFRRALVEG